MDDQTAEIGFVYGMMIVNTSQDNSSENVSWHRMDLKTDHAEGEHDVETVPKELLDLVDIHAMRSWSNIGSSLEVNLRT